MCGIAGIFLLDNRFENKLEKIIDMTTIMSHRGPDHEEYFISSNVAFGHRRLSIIDLSSNGKQPMFNEDESLVLVFNGEIYNYEHLKSQLLRAGHIFKSDCDSEVILHLYEDYGDQCVKYLEGMFAFAIYDKKKESLFLARDRIGEKPLYYFRDNSCFYFSSEIKSFFKLDSFNKNLSATGIHAYFNYIQIPPPKTIFEGVKKVRQAHWLKIALDGVESTSAYWHVDCINKSKTTLGEAKHHLKELMQETVKKVLVSDVPVGILLSGGVDSSLILGLAIEAGRMDVKTFTVGNVNGEDKEYLRARKIASTFNVVNHVYDYSEANFSELIKAAKMCDEPIGLLEIFYMFGIFGNIKEHAKVILTGNGADEVFAGYTTYSKVRQMSDYTAFLKPIIGQNNNFINSAAATFNIFNKGRVLKKLYSNEIKQHSRIDSASEILFQENMKLVSYDNLLDAKLFMDLFILCSHGMTGIPDLAGMSHSVEVRSPFLNHKIIEFAAKLPVEFKVHDKKDPFYNKFILKELACEYFDREDVFVNKYGYGYFINAYTLIKTKWRNEIEDTIFDSQVSTAGLFNMVYVQKMWKLFLKDLMSKKEKLIFARFVMFCVWYKFNFSCI